MSQVETSTDAVQRRPWLLIAVAAALSLAVAAVAVVALWPKSGIEKLAANDSQGAKACEMLASWLRGDLDSLQTGHIEDIQNVSFSVSQHAADATTPAIRSAVGPPTLDDTTLARLYTAQYFARNPRYTDLQKLHAACAGAGVDMPVYTDRPATHG